MKYLEDNPDVAAEIEQLVLTKLEADKNPAVAEPTNGEVPTNGKVAIAEVENETSAAQK